MKFKRKARLYLWIFVVLILTAVLFASVVVSAAPLLQGTDIGKSLVEDRVPNSTPAAVSPNRADNTLATEANANVMDRIQAGETNQLSIPNNMEKTDNEYQNDLISDRVEEVGNE